MATRPGVSISESLLAATATTGNSGAVSAFVGGISQGPVGPTFVTSWTLYQKLFGGFVGANQSVAHSVYQFFQNGGAGAYIVRALHSDAVTASRSATANRNISGASTTPIAIDFNADNAGAWGNQIYLEIVPGSNATVVTLIVRLVPLGSPAVTNQMIVETWTDVSLDPTNPRYILTLLNNSLNGSIYLTPALHAGYAYNPLNGIYPGDVLVTSTGGAVGSGTPLTAGADGTFATTGASGDIMTAVALLSTVYQPFVLNCPEITDSTTVNALISFADPAYGGRGDVFCVFDCQVGRTPSQVITDISSWTQSSFGAVYYPRLIVPDPSSNVSGAIRTVPPGGIVVGQYAQTDATRGVFKTPAGIGNRLPVLDVETRLKNSDLDALNSAGINAIRYQPGAGICIFGGRTLKPSPADMYIAVRRSLIYIESGLQQVTAFAVFETNDGLLWDHLINVVQPFLRNFWTAGGLAGDTPDQAYFVVCSEENNTEATIAAGEVHVQVGVALEIPAEFVIINIGQFQSGGSTAVESAA